MSSRALPGRAYVAAPSVRVRTLRCDGRSVWFELLVRGMPAGRITKVPRSTFEQLFTPVIPEEGAAQLPAPSLPGGLQ